VSVQVSTNSTVTDIATEWRDATRPRPAVSVAIRGTVTGTAKTAGTPAYAEWVATVDGEVTVSYVDMMALNDLDSEEDDPSDDSGNLEDIEDPMIGVPLSGMFVAMFTAGFGLAGPRLSNLITFDEEQTNEDEFDTSIDDLLITNETTVMTGDVVTDEIDSTVTAATENDYGRKSSSNRRAK